MSIECGYCERDLRGPHADDCPKIREAMQAFHRFYCNYDDVEWQEVGPHTAFVAGFKAGQKSKRKTRTLSSSSSREDARKIREYKSAVRKLRDYKSAAKHILKILDSL